MLPEASMHERVDGSGTGARRPITGVERLRERRGKERVTFADVADHLQDFAVANPDQRDLIDRLGTFLADVLTDLKLLEPVDELLNAVAQPIDRLVKAAAPLIAAMRVKRGSTGSSSASASWSPRPRTTATKVRARPPVLINPRRCYPRMRTVRTFRGWRWQPIVLH